MVDASSAEQQLGNKIEAKKFSPVSFKAQLLSLHHELLGSTLQDFDANKNFMGGGITGTDGAKIRYPRRRDKDALLDYAVEKANACKDSKNAALLLATAAVAVHPFVEGNGRISRALYCDLLGRPRIDEKSMPRDGDAGLESRKLIDLGTAFVDDPLLSKLAKNHPYLVTGTQNRGIRAVIHKEGESDVEAITLSDEALAGLDPEEQEDLIGAIGGDQHGNIYRKDQSGWIFSIDSLMQRNPDLSGYIKASTGGGEIVNIHELLPHMTSEQKKELVASFWVHRKLFAQAAIDFLSDDFGSKQVTVGSETISLRDFVIQRTNNFQKSTGAS